MTDPQIDWSAVEREVRSYMAFVESDDFTEDNDADQVIAEAAIEAVFGKEVWRERINPRIR